MPALVLAVAVISKVGHGPVGPIGITKSNSMVGAQASE